MVYDGSDLSGKVIGNDTGDFNDQEFHSNGTDMFINFISDANSDSVSTGFNASFSIGIYILLYISYLIKCILIRYLRKSTSYLLCLEGEGIVDPCGDRKPFVYEGDALLGNITSPNYPQPYGSNHDCEWKISVDPSLVIEIIVFSFDIEDE